MEPAPDILGADTRPAFFPVANAADIGLDPPEPRSGGTAVRTWVRALAGMQKEALVINGATGRTWRLVSDEGPYLAGHDRAPCPLCHFVTGMVSSFMSGVGAAAGRREVELPGLEVEVENFYTMEGSALKGSMTGGALRPRVQASVADTVDEPELREIVETALRVSPVNGLLGEVLGSLFTLHHNGEHVAVTGVGALGSPPQPDPGDAFRRAEVAQVRVAENPIVRLRPADLVEGVPGGVESSLEESQSRTLQVRGRGRLREDGVKEIVENLYSPIGSEFRFLSDEAQGSGGTGLAPDAVTYISAGLGFCFMTQIGRYAAITRKQLDAYRIVQDTHFHTGDDTSPGRMDPVETHVYLDTPEDEDFAQKVLAMGEQTCFLHATCRTPLGIDIDVGASRHSG